MKTTIRVLWAGLMAGAIVATAAPITPGNLLVYRVDGNGAPLGSDAAIVRIDEYDLAGNLIQTFTMPSGGSGTRLTGSGTATSEGKITVSPNGQYVGIVGYDAAENAPSVITTINRTVARIKTTDGSVDLSTTGPLGGNDNARAAAFDDTGTQIWAALNGGTGTGPTARGIRYLTLGQTTTGTLLTNINSRGVRIFSGQLYEWGDAAGNMGVYAVGTGLPTAPPAPPVALPGIGDVDLDTYGFYMADLDTSVPGYDTLWMARDATGVSKYSLVGGTWTLNNTIDPGTVFHIDGIPRAGGVILAIVNGSAAGNTVEYLFDNSGYNQPMSGSFTVLATAPSFNAFRGVAFVVPEPGTVGLLALASTAVAVVRRRRVAAEPAE
ncbi:MAG: PEP-CTERM sorting domain-containing protein [Kiritimatiellae bacterium]|nr:PEP-CTERM sorting domain-containing protein [Kiritimatiellia bacterium]